MTTNESNNVKAMKKNKFQISGHEVIHKQIQQFSLYIENTVVTNLD